MPESALADQLAAELAREPDAASRTQTLKFIEVKASALASGETLDTAQSQWVTQRVKIGDLVRNGVPPPSFLPSPRLGERLFYEGRLSLFAGHKKVGKSWLETILAADVIAAGRPVVYIDNENGANLFASRLIAAGADANRVDALLHYVPFPRLGSVSELRDEFDAIAKLLPRCLVVLDSQRSFMAQFGLKPNDQMDVEQFCGPIMAAVKSTENRITVNIIDHSNRNTTEKSDYAAGGSAGKAQAVDVVYYCDKIEPFSREIEGKIKLSVKDDREGHLDFERFYKIGGQGDDLPLYFEQTDKGEVGIPARIRAALRDVFSDAPGEKFSKNALRKKVTGDGQEIDRTVDALVSDPNEPVHATATSPPKYFWDEGYEPASLAI